MCSTIIFLFLPMSICFIYSLFFFCCIFICNNEYIHLFIYTSIILIYLYIDTSIHTYIHTSIHTSIHLYIHTYVHQYIHTSIHIYIRTYRHDNSEYSISDPLERQTRPVYYCYFI